MSEGQISGDVANTIWNNREEIGKWLAGVWSWFRKPETVDNRGILLLGAGGVGKTTLGKMLSGEYDFLLDVPGRYEESISREQYALKDQTEVEIIVPPGQEHRRLSTWGDLNAAVSAGKFRGVIFVGAYGYHTIGDYDYRQHKLYAGDKNEFLSRYLEERREQEMAIVRDLIPHLAAGQRKVWLLSVITKQDLWWPKDDQAQHFYRAGLYSACIEQLLNRPGSPPIRHELVFTSLVISNFVTGRSVALMKNSSGYDQHMQVASLRKLFEAIGAMRKWELES